MASVLIVDDDGDIASLLQTLPESKTPGFRRARRPAGARASREEGFPAEAMSRVWRPCQRVSDLPEDRAGFTEYRANRLDRTERRSAGT